MRRFLAFYAQMLLPILQRATNLRVETVISDFTEAQHGRRNVCVEMMYIHFTSFLFRDGKYINFRKMPP